MLGASVITDSSWIGELLTIIAGGKTVAFKQPFGVKLLSGYTIINAETSERFKHIQTTVAREVSEADGPRTARTRKTSKKFQRLLHRCAKTIGEFDSRNLVQTSFGEIPMDLVSHFCCE